MSMIISVHGTGASGPEEGNRWWQRGSQFEKTVHDLIEAQDGKVQFKPLIWDGANSQVSRLAAAQKLYAEMKILEKQNEGYCVIGHSHGGSVIAHALLMAGRDKLSLPNLSKWVTVGTPFVEFKKSRFLFSRLGPYGKAVWAAMIALAATTLWTLYQFSHFGDFSVSRNASPEWEEEMRNINRLRHEIIPRVRPGYIGAMVLITASFLTLTFLGARGLYEFRKRVRDRARKAFSSKWIGLSHSNDEAASALSSLPNLRPRIFGDNAIVEAISLLGVVCAAAVTAFIPIGELPTPVVLAPVFIFLFATVIARIFLWIAPYISRAASALLNRAAWSQMRRKGYGADGRGQSAIGSHSSPTWTNLNAKPLPIEINTMIEERSNAAAALSLAKLRGALSTLALSEDEEASAALISRYLTWDELIHTSYFAVPSFNRLLCHAIANSPGFKPTEQFRSSDDYSQLGRWIEELRPALAEDVATSEPLLLEPATT